MSKAIGSTLIIAGTTVGAGMLALPILSANEGFPYAIITLIVLWALMLYGGLILLEANLHFPHGTSFSTLGIKTLGRFGQLITNLCMMLLFYCLTAAYIAGGTEFLTTGLKDYLGVDVPHWLNSLLFTAVLGGLVSWKTYAVDITNRILLSVKILAFFSAIFLLLPHVHYSLLTPHPDGSRFILMTIPIFFTAFGFHGSVPSIVKYIGHRPKTLSRIFIIGSFIPLILYFLWEIVTLGILPQQGSASFASIAAQHGSVATFIVTLADLVNNKFVTIGINVFTDIAVTTSFLGVTLGLFDFFADMVKATHHTPRRVWVTFITFVPPLLFALLYPKGFIMALGYAAIPLALLAAILPALMVWKIRATNPAAEMYRVPGGKFGLVIMLLFGCIVILLQLLAVANKLPT